MFKKNDHDLLQEAYLSISKKTPEIASDSPGVTTDPNDVVEVGPMDEPAPGTNASIIDTHLDDMSPDTDSKSTDTVGVPVSMSAGTDCDCDSGCGCDLAQEDEEDQMTIDNLNSIRESIVKIAEYCAGGGHLETWAQQKLAISMDNLAEVARRLKLS